MLGVMIAAARWTIRRLAVPYALRARTAIGLGALGLLLIAEVMGVLWVRGVSVRDYFASFSPLSGGVSLLLFLLFAAMPMLVERR
jgi:hypothetical protein